VGWVTGRGVMGVDCTAVGTGCVAGAFGLRRHFNDAALRGIGVAVGWGWTV